MPRRPNETSLAAQLCFYQSICLPGWKARISDLEMQACAGIPDTTASTSLYWAFEARSRRPASWRKDIHGSPRVSIWREVTKANFIETCSSMIAKSQELQVSTTSVTMCPPASGVGCRLAAKGDLTSRDIIRHLESLDPSDTETYVDLRCICLLSFGVTSLPLQ